MLHPRIEVTLLTKELDVFVVGLSEETGIPADIIHSYLQYLYRIETDGDTKDLEQRLTIESINDMYCLVDEATWQHMASIAGELYGG